MKKEELRNVLREKNQKVSGSKEELIERILSNQEKVTDESVVISDKESTGKELPEKVTVSEIERLLEENRLLK
ncbi:SAP domain-containing protein, partial [Lacticaseibacillus rhamnosus]|uniref:SAP domain-containing protein n=1 Tax=Lacticaseibacillus rhamnosus TaxID=47715 RepID=UPI003F6E7CA4